MKTIQWGILGTGYAAKQFAQGLSFLHAAKLLAIGSRQQETADTFSRQFNVPRSYNSYEKLVMDKDLDIVYIATPHVMHKDHCCLALEAGKAVVCEKPFTLNANEAREVIQLARQQNLFCMEAMWTRFLPLVQIVPKLLQEGVIGEVQMLMADFGIRIKFDEQDRHFNQQLGGGALLDLGVYPLSLAYYLLGSPARVVSQCTWGKTQVDEQATVTLSYASGALAVLSCSLLTTTPTEAILLGSRGLLRIHAPLYRPSKLSIKKFAEVSSSSNQVKGGRLAAVKQWPWVRSFYDRYLWRPRPSTQFIPYQGNGYNYEAAEAMRCLNQGELESKIMPLEETLKIMETLDTLRAQWR